MARPQRPGLRNLIRSCPDMQRVRDVAGLPRPRRMEQGFATLLRIIVDQQVSTQSGAAIWQRLSDSVPIVTPQSVSGLGEAGLRQTGFSGAKARYGMALAGAVLDGSLPLESLSRMTDRRVEEHLTQVKGIGRWTAEIYLMFALGRSDIWPAGDLAVAEATGQLLGLSQRPGLKEMDNIAERWRPWRSTAALMLWHYYRYLRGRSGGAPGV